MLAGILPPGDRMHSVSDPVSLRLIEHNVVACFVFCSEFASVNGQKYSKNQILQSASYI